MLAGAQALITLAAADDGGRSGGSKGVWRETHMIAVFACRGGLVSDCCAGVPVVGRGAILGVCVCAADNLLSAMPFAVWAIPPLEVARMHTPATHCAHKCATAAAVVVLLSHPYMLIHTPPALLRQHQQQLLPPEAYPDMPLSSLTTRFVASTQNKTRCAIFCARFAPDGRRVLTGDNSGGICVWNSADFMFQQYLQVCSYAWVFAWAFAEEKK